MMLESIAPPVRRRLLGLSEVPKSLNSKADAMHTRSSLTPAFTPISSGSTRTRRMKQKLPQEIVDRIIDCLWDQRQHLIKCTSVSRCFVRRSQQHLFAKIFLFPSLEQNFEALLRRSPHLIPYIKDLAVSIRAIEPTSLVQILPLLTRLKSLTIKTYGGTVVNWDTEVPVALRSAFKSVFRSNRLGQIIFQDIRNFDAGLLAKCSSIRMLAIAGGGTLAVSSRRKHGDIPPELSSVMVGAGKDSLQSFLKCSLTELPAFSLGSLQWLFIREMPGKSWKEAFEALTKLMSTLAHLVVDFKDQSWSSTLSESADPPIDLSALSSLVSLELRNTTAYDQTLFSEKAASILLTLPVSSRLVQLTLRCPGSEFATYQTPSLPTQWKAVDTALSFCEIASLKQVHFKIGANIFPTHGTGFNLLPWTNSRGVVTRISKIVHAV